MKLHLPKVLLSAVLTACCAFSTHAAEIPDTYEQIDVWDAGYLTDYTTNTETDYYAFLLGMGITVPSDIQMDGGNLLFTTYDGLSPVSLKFTDGDTPALRNQSSLTFDTLSRLSFADFSAEAISESGNLIIQNVNDGVDNPENADVSFASNSFSISSASTSSYYTNNGGGAIYASNDVTISSNGDVAFTKNRFSFSSMSSGSRYSSNGGGAIYAGNDVTISSNGDVSFTENSCPVRANWSSDSGGGAIYADNIDISCNGNVSFSGNSTSSSYGGAIYARYDLIISENADIFFSENSCSSSGGAIRAYNIDISCNGDVSFSGNSAASAGGGGAMGVDGVVTISGNGDVSFSGNSAAFGGAISAYEVSISCNGDVSFSGNSAAGAFGGGGAMDVDGVVTISCNGDVAFSGNSAEEAGAAIRADEVTISSNGDVSFTGNSCRDNWTSDSGGGAIYADNIDISCNGNVTFTGNSTPSTSSSAASYGGAIYAGNDVTICGNEKVCFERNYESDTSGYRLRSIYTARGLNLSAKASGYITIYDSVYGGITTLNADYTDADGVTQQAKGDIIFSGQYTKAHLDAILEANNEGRVATEDEILNSRTSTLGDTTLHGGSLHVVDGAILDTTSLTVAADSSAHVLLRDAGLNGAISFGTGTSLELQGKNTTTGSLTLGDGVSLTVTLDNSHQEKAALVLTGSVSTGTLGLNLNVAEERASGMYSILSVGSLSTADAWIAENVNVQGSGAAAGATFADLLWQDGTLYYAASPVWSNYSGSMVWSSTDANWNNGSVFRAGQEVIFMDRGAGEVQLVGELTPASIHVQNTEGNDYTFTGSGKLSGETTLTKTGAGELTISTANDYTGKTDLQGGTLNVHHSTALGATATGEATLTTAAGTTLKVANSSHLVLAGDYDLAGNVDVAEGATLELQKDGRAAGTLSGSGTLQATNSQVSVDAISNSFTGNLKVEGKGAGMSIASGSYTGTATLSVAGGTLTFGAKANITLNAGGQLVLQSWDDAVASVTANNITVRAGATLAAKTAVAALGGVPEISSQELSADLNCARLTLNAGATLETDGACFDLNNGVLTLAVTSATTDKIELVLAENAVYTGSEQIALFVNVGQGIFAYDGINTSTGEESLYTLNAADYFTGMGINESTQLVYDSTTGTVYLQGVVSIPEPASATLGLIALAALAMRRRCK